MSSTKKPVVVRQVWAENLYSEFLLIHDAIRRYPIAAVDTEFPGFIFKACQDHNSPSEYYALMKKNVDALNIIQVGLTLSDYYGDLPDFGKGSGHVWEFNFCDFDIDRDLYDSESIALLKRQGIDFSKNKKDGIDS